MQWILTLIIQYKNFLLFLFLLGIGIVFSSYRSTYHQNKLQKVGLIFSGRISKSISTSQSYLSLRERNKKLLLENNILKQKLINQSSLGTKNTRDFFDLDLVEYVVEPAYVVKNSFSKARNVLIIDKGELDGIKKDMSVISSDGIVGIVKQTSDHFSSVISILYQDFKINAKLKNSGAFGSLSWEGGKPDEMIFSDVSVINEVKVGDTIVSGGMSAYFPKGIPIGIIKSYDNQNSGGYYSIKIKLFNNLTDLENVYIIDNKKRSEFLDLENTSSNDSR
jgi:rod shape-determining protein MreC